MRSVIGEKIRTRRIQLEMSLDDLASASESSKGYLWELENREKANPSADKLIKIAAALGVTTEFLLDPSADAEPGVGILDEAFFRRYKQLDIKKKEKVQKFLDMWEDDD